MRDNKQHGFVAVVGPYVIVFSESEKNNTEQLSNLAQQ